MSELKASTVLREAWKLIRVPSHWTKGTDHTVKYVRGKKVHCYCARGAVNAAAMKLASGGTLYLPMVQHAKDILTALTPPPRDPTQMRSIIGYNDNKRRTHDQIADWFKRAIAKAEAEERVR